MSDQKLLQAILDKVTSLDKSLISMDDKMISEFQKVNERIDRLGRQLATLD